MSGEKKKKAMLEKAINEQYPDAEIIAYYETVGEMIFYPNPISDTTISCKFKNGRIVFEWDF